MRVISMMGVQGPTTRVVTSNEATAIAAGVLVSDGRICENLLILCDPGQENSARIAFGGATPTVGLTGVGVWLYPGDGVRLVGEKNCASMKHISGISGDASALQITPEY